MVDTPSMKATAVKSERNYLDINYDIISWLFPLDHKRIAMLFLVTMSLFVFIGGAMAGLLRAELSNPREQLFYADIYNRIFTMHGITMVYFFVLPALLAVFGGFVLPLAIGARQLAHPHLNLFSLHLYLVGGVLLLLSLTMGGVEGGWNFVTPYATLYASGYTCIVLLSMLLVTLAMVLLSINLIATIHTMRAHGLTWFKLPLFVWTSYIASVLLVIASPFLLVFVILVAMQSMFAKGWISFGGELDPLLTQGLFWLFVRAAVYSMIFPAIGVTADIIVSFARKPLHAYKSTLYTLFVAAAFMVLSWGTHFSAALQPVAATLFFSILSFIMLGALALVIINLLATLTGGQITFEAPMIYALTFLGNMIIAWVAWLFLSAPSTNMVLQGTQFETAFFHYLMVGGVVTAFMAALHYWWPKMTGRTYQEGWGRIAAGVLFTGVQVTYFPQLMLGYLGMRSRVPLYPAEFEMANKLASEGFFVLAIGLLMPVVYLTVGLIFGKSANSNVWGDAIGLEWFSASPPPLKNFAAVPAVTGEAYRLDAEIIDDVIVPALAPAIPSAEPDDLTKIEGIGPKISGLLQAAGISTFAQLAQVQVSQLQHILTNAGPRYRMADPDTWPKQAALAAAEKWDELKELQGTLRHGKHV